MTSARTSAEAVEVLILGLVTVSTSARTSAEAVEVLIRSAGVEPSTTLTGVTMFRR